MRDFALAPAESRDRDVEFNEAVVAPLLETELQTLLSGGRASAATVISIPKSMGDDEPHDCGHDH